MHTSTRTRRRSTWNIWRMNEFFHSFSSLFFSRGTFQIFFFLVFFSVLFYSSNLFRRRNSIHFTISIYLFPLFCADSRVTPRTTRICDFMVRKRDTRNAMSLRWRGGEVWLDLIYSLFHLNLLRRNFFFFFLSCFAGTICTP